MKKKKYIFLIIGLFLIVIPYFINVYSIYRLISVCLGIILVDISFIFQEKKNIFLLFYFPILLLIFTYSIDYIKTYTLNLKSIFVIENKINEKVSIYNSLLYRVFDCDGEYIFDNNYEDNYNCDTSLITEIDINKLLNEPKNSYHEYKNDFIKVRGKISKISGTSSIELQAYTEVDGSVNGYVKFNETSKLIINLNGDYVSNYKIYDYIIVVGLLDSYDSKTNTLTLTDTLIEENNIYDNYDIHVIESSKCSHELKEYVDGVYLYCLDNIYLDYKVDKYELSYSLKDKKVTLDSIKKGSETEVIDDKKVFYLDKFNIISCSEDKNIFVSKEEKINVSICEEE